MRPIPIQIRGERCGDLAPIQKGGFILFTSHSRLKALDGSWFASEEEARARIAEGLAGRLPLDRAV